MCWAAPAAAGDIEFGFDIPRMPYPPVISDVSSSAAVTGASYFTVAARITAQEQKKGFCDVIPESECTTSDWYLAPDPDVAPNPPTIRLARVYYYRNDGVTSASYVDMTYDPAIARYRADVPLDGAGEGDTIAYYIVAVDSLGNVASQAPDSTQRPCPSSSSWDETLATPVTSSCAYATSREQCGRIVSGQPEPCPEDEYTVADTEGDVCGEPDSSGNQNIISGPDADKVDILGISAGADSTYICTKVGINAAPPDSTDPPPIEAYIMLFYNPEMPDLNPADTHVENAYAAVYVPEAYGTDSTLAKVLWDGDCMTDPDTADPLSCKLVAAVGASEDLKIEYNQGSLRFMTKKSGTGYLYDQPYNLLGGSSQSSILKVVTGEINLSGGTVYWTADSTPAMAFYHGKKTVTVEPAREPAAPFIIGTTCGDGLTSVCRKQTAPPPDNKCTIHFKASLDAAFTDEYRVYRNTTDDYSTAAPVGDVADVDGVSSYTFEDAHTTLDGATYYYYLAGYNSAADKETPLEDAAATTCTVEDWVAPSPPVITSAATPPGNTGKCRLDWTVDADPSLAYFYISYDGAPLNYPTLMASDGVTEYSYTVPATFPIGDSVTFTVSAMDLGENTAESLSATCTPQDLEAPDRVNSLIATNLYGKLGVEMNWVASSEDDLAGYNVYYCPQSNYLVDCREQEEFTRMNSSLITETDYKRDSTQAPGIISGEGNYCFYIEACDDCDNQGTCPDNGGSSNCSGFPTGGADSTLYVKCLTLTQFGGTDPPAWPGGLACNAPAEGNKIIVEWDRVCYYAAGYQFTDYKEDPNCATPTPEQVVGYKVIFGDSGAVPFPASASTEDIAGITSVGMPTQIEHSNLINGQQYCYNVAAVDAGANYSTDGPGGTRQEVCCTPQDTLAPDSPEMQDIPHTATSCDPAWYSVQDEDAVTYSLYRCNSGASECAAAGDFTAIATGLTGGDVLSLGDYDVNADSIYTYCATAVDASGNESAVYDSADTANCGVCAPGNRPNAPSAVGAAILASQTGSKLYWTDSPDHSGGGYNVYRCSGSDCASPGSPVQTCVPGGRTAASPLSLDNEPCGAWYYGVTYMTDCGDPSTESLLSAMGTAISSSAVDIPCAHAGCDSRCIIVSSCKNYDLADSCVPVTVLDPSQTGGDGKYLATGKTGLEVFLADSDNNPRGDAVAVTDSNGNFKLIIDNAIAGLDTTSSYQLILKVPATQKSGIACSPGFTGDDCYIILSKEVTVLEDAEVKVSGLSLGGGGRAEIGNPDCSDSVDVGDLLIFRAAFGSSEGDDDYKTYADFDGNGSVDVEDFLILKQNFGKTLDAAPGALPILCE